jgi:HEAT repeat protein
MRSPWYPAYGGIGVLALAILEGLCLAHGEGAPPPPPPKPPVVPTYPWDLVREKVYPPRWSWIHWWEANRDPYLRSIQQGGARQNPDPKVLAATRVKAVKALAAGLTSPDPQVRAATVVALGRMGTKSLFDPLCKVAQNDVKPDVQTMSLMTIGLLDTPEAREVLLAQRYATDQLFEAGCVGLGFLRQADEPKVLEALQKAVLGDKPGLATISAWGLRRRPNPANILFLKSVLASAKSPWLASEAILALGEQGDPAAIGVLSDLLLATKQAVAVAAWKALSEHDYEITRQFGDGTRATVKPTDQVKDNYQNLSDWRNLGNPNGPSLSPAKSTIKIGREKVYLSSLRASAAIALGRIPHPAAQQVLLAAMAEKDDGYSALYKGFVIMSLGQMGDQAILPALMAHLGRTHPSGKVKTMVEIESTLRGYAALALGLYARPRQTPQGPQDQPNYDKVCAALAERLADREEELEVRAACAMGLGLSARTENLRYLQKPTETLRESEDLLAGYILLARAMLGDRGILPLAKRYLSVADEKKDSSGILGRRAAVLGLALLDSQEAIPTLLDAWHLSYHVNREVAIAFGLLRAYNVTEPLVKLLETSTNPLEQAFAARCLGELFAEERPHRLRWLLNDCNYTMKNERLMPYQSVANEFLYEYLIPCFGDQWI